LISIADVEAQKQKIRQQRESNRNFSQNGFGDDFFADFDI
jgi:hypothetical protein